MSSKAKDPAAARDRSKPGTQQDTPAKAAPAKPDPHATEVTGQDTGPAERVQQPGHPGVSN